ncbi:phosphatase PAP2 family protein [Vulcanisaeta thermophila]|uniref:phosphatase PAP2 family protein n=1 Tax=Vulcanisaeta thermophila TaxID=867917 RepID=UPI0008530E72|nr:phosphatase PAP2 family protein [Vulcanisaeta thermophila]
MEVRRNHLITAIILYVVYAALTMYVLAHGEASPFNVYIFNLIFNHENPAITPILVVLSTDDYGRALVWIPVALVLWFVGSRYERYRRASVVMVASFALSLVVGELMKHVMYEPRPFMLMNIKPLIHESTDSSYPSGHALIVGTGAYSALLTTPWYVAIPLLIEALLVTYGRVYVGVHWPIDIIAGWVLGIANVELTMAIPKYQDLIHWIMKKLLSWLSLPPK